jgi:hypothetical protein
MPIVQHHNVPRRSRIAALASGLLGVLLCSACSPAGLLTFLAGCSDTGYSADGPSQGVRTSFDRKHYRPPQASDNPLVERATRWAENIALDDSHGYSQARRDSQSDYDCSSFVWFAYKHAGIPLGGGWPFVTQTMGGILKADGFQEMTWSGNPRDAAASLQRGDVLVDPSEHTEIYAGGGLFVGARHACPGGTEDGRPGDQCAASGDEEIGIEPAYRTSMVMVYRYTGGDSPTQNPGGTDGDSNSATAVDAAWACPNGGGAINASYAGDGTHVSPENAQGIARQQLKTGYRQWDDSQYQCLVWVWNHESGWRWNATNPSSGAYGIPQALPASKLGEAGADWRDNAGTQIAWGLSYIKGRYGSPCQAQSFWQSHNWY